MKKRSKLLVVMTILLTITLLVTGCGKKATQPPENPDQQGGEEDQTYETLATDIGEFTTTDLEGNEVTNEIFKDKDVTLVFLWGTGWPSCIQEFPELVKLEAELPENAGIVGILTDVKNVDSAKKVVEETGFASKNILFNDAIYKSYEKVQYIPYTLFVDSEGKVVGKDLTGKKDLKTLKEALDIALKATEKDE